MTNDLADKGLQAGVVWARGVEVKESPGDFVTRIKELLALRREQDFPAPELKKAVRDLLRTGGYKPAGRGKPASEYLAGACKKDKFPFINNLVDINNYLSLQSGLPISMLDLAKTGSDLTLRYGREGERYVFNSVGQEIDVKGLISICQSEEEGGRPLGNPVKDSMAGKLGEDTEAIVAVIYSCEKACTGAQLSEILRSFEDLLREFAGATSVETQIV